MGRRHASLFGSLRNANLRISDGRGVCRDADLECGFLLKTVAEQHPPVFITRFGSVASNPPSPPRGHGSQSFVIGVRHEDRAVCRSPRSERRVSAFCCGGDRNHAYREFDFADLVLITPPAQTAKLSAPREAIRLSMGSTVLRRLNRQDDLEQGAVFAVR